MQELETCEWQKHVRVFDWDTIKPSYFPVISPYDSFKFIAKFIYPGVIRLVVRVTSLKGEVFGMWS